MAVLSGEFLCPECGARLRIHQPGQNEAEIDCPECSTGLNVTRAADRELNVSLRSERDDPFEQFAARQSSRRRYLVPLLIIILLAVPAVFLMLQDFEQAGDSNNQGAESGSEQSPEDEEAKPVGPPAPDQKPEKDVAQSTLPDDWKGRLRQLGTRIGEYREEHGHFPPTYWRGNDKGLSWLAGFDSNNNLSPDWRQEWNSPANDRFVRRARPDLTNPQLQKPIGVDRYPATHVVGIAGVGRDAAALPKSHPRAGIFGWNRTTRAADVTDGLSNTWMAGSVRDELSSWANGAQSIRAVTTEPYLNGPDGFGAGDPEQMPILMADGSVRTVTRKTDPRIVRRMAAMADSLPLDPAIAGEPGEMGSNQEEKDRSEEKSTTEKEEPEVEVVQQPMKPERPDRSQEIEAGLKKRIVAFELNEPTPLNQVVVELEALLGVPVEFDPDSLPAESDVRTRTVTLNAKRVSLDELFSQLLKPLELTSTIDRDRLLIQPR